MPGFEQMKWFKHFSDCFQGEEMKAQFDHFGFSGIGRYWVIMELIASQMDESDRCHYEQSDKQWSYLLRLKHKQMVYFLEQTALLNALLLEVNDKQMKITAPKLLKYRDNYTRDLVVASKQDVDVDVEGEEEVKKHVLSAKTSFAQKTYVFFSSLWEGLPSEMKKGKKRAWLNFKTQVGTEQDLQDVSKAVKNYLADITYIRETNHPERQYKNGSTFFDGEWRDWINWKPPEKPPEESLEEGYLRRRKERIKRGELDADD